MVVNVGNDIRNSSSQASTYETKVEMDAVKTTKSSQRARICATHNRTHSYILALIFSIMEPVGREEHQIRKHRKQDMWAVELEKQKYSNAAHVLKQFVT